MKYFLFFLFLTFSLQWRSYLSAIPNPDKGIFKIIKIKLIVPCPEDIDCYGMKICGAVGHKDCKNTGLDPFGIFIDNFRIIFLIGSY